MSSLSSLLETQLMQAVGWALIHVLWQGFLIGTGLWMILVLMRDRSANSRYVACLLGMGLMLAAPVVTALLLIEGISNPWTPPHGLILFTGAGDSGTGWMNNAASWLTGVWILGALGFQLRFTSRLVCADRFKRTGLTAASENLQRELGLLMDLLGIKKAVRIMESALVSVPSVVGWLSPIILIPAGITVRLTPVQIRGIIAHELAHVRRNDYLVNLIQSLFESLLFFHPMTWWISDRLRVEREFSCDDVALSVSENRLQYAQALTSLEELRQYPTPLLTAATGGTLMNRISRIFGRRNQTFFGRGIWLAPLALIIGAAAGIAVIGTGCDSSGNAIAAAVAEPGTNVAEPSAQGTELQDQVLREIQEAVERGEITEKEAADAVKMIEDNAECLASCPEGAMTIMCTTEAGPECCPDGTLNICREATDCGEGVSVESVQFGESESCTGVVVCVRKQTE
jgi:bla regulator protein BlaR1